MKLALAFAALLPSLSATAASGPTTRARFVMGTVCEISIYPPSKMSSKQALNTLTQAFEEIERQDHIMSLFKENSELFRLNREAARRSVRASENLWNVLVRSAEINRLSDGAFDPTVGPPAYGFSKVHLDPKDRSVRFDQEGLRIDPGGIGKGYALDTAAAVLRRAGVRSALINFGGQILALGTPPGQQDWDVEIEEAGLHLRIHDASVSTSSQSEHPGHILDPKTNRPVDRPGRVTVILPDAASADAWSTALFVSGAKAAPKDFRGCAIETAESHAPIYAGECRKYLLNQNSTLRVCNEIT